MAFESFPNLCYFKTLGTSEMPHGGGFLIGRDMRLKYSVITLYKHGAHVGAERLRLKLYHDSSLTKLYASSAWVSINDIPGVGNYWLGRLRFEFESNPDISSLQRYYLACETDSYTRVGNSFYLGIMLDWPIATSVQEDAPYYSWKAEFYGYRRLVQ